MTQKLTGTCKFWWSSLTCNNVSMSLYFNNHSGSWCSRGVANSAGYIGHCWMMKTRRNTITFLVFFQEKCRAIKFNLVVETLFSFCLFDFFCSRQTNNLNMKQQPQKQWAGTFSGSIWRNLKILIREVSSNVCHWFCYFYVNLLKDNWRSFLWSDLDMWRHF